MREIAIALLRLPSGEVVMQRRDASAKNSPNLLGFFGGHVEEGEQPDEAVQRELAEETSLDTSSLMLEHVETVDIPSSSSKQGSYVRAHFFTTEIQLANFEVYEGVGAEVFTVAELLKRTDVAPTARYFLQNLA